MTLYPNGQFTFTPTQDFNGEVTFDFKVTNAINEQAGPYTATLVFDPINDAPVLNTIIVSDTIRSAVPLSFTATASDVDLTPGEQLVFSITNPAAGAAFDTNTGAFLWSPVYSWTGSNTYTFTITVSDGVRTDSQDVTVTVLPQIIYLPIVFR